MMNNKFLTLEDDVLVLILEADRGVAFSDAFDNLEGFVAIHFHEISKRILDSLDWETVKLLLSISCVKIEQE